MFIKKVRTHRRALLQYIPYRISKIKYQLTPHLQPIEPHLYRIEDPPGLAVSLGKLGSGHLCFVGMDVEKIVYAQGQAHKRGKAVAGVKIRGGLGPIVKELGDDRAVVQGDVRHIDVGCPGRRRLGHTVAEHG